MGGLWSREGRGGAGRAVAGEWGGEEEEKEEKKKKNKKGASQTAGNCRLPRRWA